METQKTIEAIETKKFNAEEALLFVQRNSYKFPEGFNPFGKNIVCIDDRRTKSSSKREENEVAIPGAGLGITLAVFKTIDALKEKYKADFVLNDELIVRQIESVIGVSYHTDEDAETKRREDVSLLSCGGCGHCAGILNSENFPKNFGNFIKTYYLPKLKDEGVMPTIYAGKHNANAVIIIDDLETGLHSKGSDGQVYVYHRAWHKLLSEKVADAIYSDLTSLLNGLEKKELCDALLEASGAQFIATATKLASHLPKFSQTGELLAPAEEKVA